MKKFKGLHTGSDIWVLASGASMTYMHESFFNNKITLGVNSMYKKFPCMYTIVKEQELIQPAVLSGSMVFCSKYNCGGNGELNNGASLGAIDFDHLPNAGTSIDLSPVTDESDRLVVSYSTITSALHLAYYMGAKNIIVCGHDCGKLDGEMNFKGYYDYNINYSEVSRFNSAENMYFDAEGRKEKYNGYVSKFLPQTMQVINKLRSKGVNVCSINPFINFQLEGHEYAAI